MMDGAAPRSVAAKAADDTGIDVAIRALYETLSGPAGQKRDFDRLRGLFAPGALMRILGPEGLRGGTVEDYIERSGALLEEKGFTERELGRRVEAWGDLATAWSAYEGRSDDGSFHARGINSFQLVRIDGKWLIASILWQEETPEESLPDDLIERQREK
jgi:hypothetical protein